MKYGYNVIWENDVDNILTNEKEQSLLSHMTIVLDSSPEIQ